MLNVLVVDDEPKVRRGLSALINLYPDKYYLTGCCTNAQQAIDILGKSVPDVILTDIRMPDQDGLELIGYLKHRYQNLDFIIISGYSDFEYARKALQFQVFDFLLKPLKPEELYKTLDGVARKRSSSHITRLESIEDNHFLNLIRSATEEEEEKNLEILGLSELKKRYCVSILDARINYEKFIQKYGSLEYAVKKYLPETRKNYTCFGYQFISIWEKSYSDRELEEILQNLEEKFETRFYLGISKWKQDYREVKSAYFEALDAAKQYIYSDCGKIIRTETRKEKAFTFSREQCEKIMNAVRSGNTVLVETLLREVFEECKKKRYGICELKQLFIRIFRNIEIVSEELGMDNTCCNSIRSFLRNIEEIEDFAEIEKIFISNLELMAKTASEISEWKMGAQYLKEIISFIEENYGNPISLEDIATHVNLSVGYLSNYFKEKMGMSFTDYLLKIRMEKAKELLAHTNEKIYRIAELTGYQNSQYFVTVFKRNIGVTPAEYRKYLKK